MGNGSNNSQNGYSVQFVAAFPYLNAANTNQQAQQPAPLINTQGGADAPGTEFDGYGITPAGQDNAGKGVEPNGKSVTPAGYQADLVVNPNLLTVSRAPIII
jgi:hypothetical protein